MNLVCLMPCHPSSLTNSEWFPFLVPVYPGCLEKRLLKRKFVVFAANNCTVETVTNFATSIHFQMDTWCGWSWQSFTGRLALFSPDKCAHCLQLQNCSDRTFISFELWSGLILPAFYCVQNENTDCIYTT